MKKTLAIAFVLLFVPCILFAKSIFPEATPTLEKDLFWTNIFFKKDSQTAVMNFRVWFKHPPDLVWKTLTDTANFKTKMNNYNEAKTLSRALFDKIAQASPTTYTEIENIIGANQLISDHNRRPGKNWTDYVYFRFNFPWPLTDRWSVQKMKCDETNAAQGEYKLEYKAQVSNFKDLQGYWKLVPIPNHPGWTEFHGSYESNAGISVPKFVTKKAMSAGLQKDVDAYRKILSAK